MKGTPRLEDVLAMPAPNRRRKFPIDVRRARSLEQSRRNGLTQARAYQALARLHPDEYRDLYEQAKELLNAERGPLPGDEP